jgi:hypothetical protein
MALIEAFAYFHLQICQAILLDVWYTIPWSTVISLARVNLTVLGLPASLIEVFQYAAFGVLSIWMLARLVALALFIYIMGTFLVTRFWN